MKIFFKRFLCFFLLFLFFVGFLPFADPVTATLTYYNDGWSYRKTITIDTSLVDVNLPNYPLLFRNTSLDYRMYAQVDGDDFLFTDSAGTRIPHEIESYNQSTGELIAWVNVPLISSAADTVIYLYYGNASATNQEDTSNVWDANYVSVWHMNEQAGDVVDSKGNHNFTTVTATPYRTGETIGYGRYYPDAASSLKTTYAYPSMNTYTLDCWMNFSSAIGGATDMVETMSVTNPGIFRDGTEKLQIWASGGFIGTSINTFADTDWHWVSFGNNGFKLSLYTNLTRENDTVSGFGIYPTNNDVFTLGDNTIGTDTFRGYIDEARISNTARNWTYHNTTYRNLYNPEGYYAVSSPTTLKYIEFNPIANGGHIGLTPASANWIDVNLNDNQGVWRTPYSYGFDVYSIQDHTTQQGTILNVTVVSRVSCSHDNVGKHTIFSGATYINGTEFTIPAGSSPPNQVWRNTTFATNPFSGVAWTWDEVDDYQWGVALKRNVATSWPFCFYYKLVVWYNSTITTHPTDLTATMINATKIGVTWTNNVYGNTVVTRKLGSPPVTPNDGVIVYNGTGTSYIDTGLVPAKNYSYKSWCFNTTRLLYGIGNSSDNTTTQPERIMSSTNTIKRVLGIDYINITWVNASGKHHNRTVIRKSLTTQPILPTDGTGVYNGTGLPFFNQSFVLSYYSIFHYNGSLPINKYSIATYVTSYYFRANVYNESSGIALTNWNIQVSNHSGSQVYIKNNCNNTAVIPLSLMPSGTGCTITFSRTNFTTKTYTQTISKTGNYNISGYLAHFTLPTTPPTNTSYLYLLTVVTDTGGYYTTALPDVLLTVKKVVNGSYVAVSSGMTDGAGQFSTYLIPGQSYKFYLNKTGYTDQIADWTPSDSLFTHTFQMYLLDVAPSQCLDFWSTIDFTATMDTINVTHIYYYDSTGNTTNTTLYVYEFYNTTTTFLSSDFKAMNNSFYWNISMLNKTRTYIVVLYFNSTNDFCEDENVKTITVYPLTTWSNHTKFDLEQRITNVFGGFDIAGSGALTWIGFFFSLAPIIILTLFDPAHVGIGILATGFFMAGIQAVLSAWTVTSPPAMILVCIPVVIVIGVLYLLGQRNGYL